MIREKITFLTGAGASKDYGYPLGSELLDELIKYTSRDLRQPLMGINRFNDIDFDAIHSRLRESNIDTIDRFLEINPEMMALGKYLITYSLLMKENPIVFERFHEQSSKSNWLNFIWHLMIEGVHTPEEFSQNKIGFVTFNYDRTLEYFFSSRLQNLFKLSFSESVILAKYIPIIHVYGDLGGYESLTTTNTNYLKYQSYNERRLFSDNAFIKIQHWSDHILTINTRNKSPHFAAAIKLLLNSDKIYSIGFGFDWLNIERLNLVEVAKAKSFRALLVNERNGKLKRLSDLFTGTNYYPYGATSIMMMLEQDF
jgi:hypothetical protein